MRIIEPDPNNELIDLLAKALDINPLLATLLANRGMLIPQDAKKFLSGSLRDLYKPNILPDSEKAATRLLEAIKGDEKILIYGDYDVDGITGTALLKKYLEQLGAFNIIPFIPNRFKEGYGLNCDALQNLLEKENIDLIVTVDCGINAFEAVNLALGFGVDTIITDHHEADRNLPAAHSLINPKLPGSGYPFDGLAGVGVAFKLCQAMQYKVDGKYWSDFLLDLLPLVALGTVADLVPLINENRILTKAGLARLNEKPPLGLKILLADCAIKGPVNAGHISFMIAPRLNAAGRLADGSLALELLLTSNAERAQEIVTILNELNEQRQALEKKVVDDGAALFEGLPDKKVLVGSSREWHQGVIGIAASRLTERFKRPVLLISLSEEKGRGSGRSIKGFNLYEALAATSKHLSNFGGHKMAAGFDIQKDSIEAFDNSINTYAIKHLSNELLIPFIEIDAEISLAALTPELVESIDAFGPFGIGNPKPIFFHSNLELVGKRKVGREEEHLALQLKEAAGPQIIKGIAFGKGNILEDLAIGARYCTAFSPTINNWGGVGRLELEVRTILPERKVCTRIPKSIIPKDIGPIEIINGSDIEMTRRWLLEHVANLLLESDGKGLCIVPDIYYAKSLIEASDRMDFDKKVLIRQANGLMPTDSIAEVWNFLNSCSPRLLIATPAFSLNYIDKFPPLQVLAWESPFLSFPRSIYADYVQKISKRLKSSPLIVASGYKTNAGNQPFGQEVSDYDAGYRFEFFDWRDKKDKDSVIRDVSGGTLLFTNNYVQGAQLQRSYPALNIISPASPFTKSVAKKLVFYDMPTHEIDLLQAMANIPAGKVYFLGEKACPKPEQTVRQREKLAAIYRYIRREIPFSVWRLLEPLVKQYGDDKELFFQGIDIFSEMGLVKRRGNGKDTQVYLCKPNGVTDLFSATGYHELINEAMAYDCWQKTINQKNFSQLLKENI